MSERNMRKVVVGKVVSNKMDKTIVVACYNNSLVHLVAYNLTDNNFSHISLTHC